MSITTAVTRLFGDDGRSLPPVDLPQDTVFDALSTARRRFVLTYLFANGASTLGDIADDRATVEHGLGYSSDDRKAVYISLYQCHCKRLDEMGAVDFDRERGMVEPTRHTDALAQWAQAADEATVEEGMA